MLCQTIIIERVIIHLYNWAIGINVRTRHQSEEVIGNKWFKDLIICAFVVVNCEILRFVGMLNPIVDVAYSLEKIGSTAGATLRKAPSRGEKDGSMTSASVPLLNGCMCVRRAWVMCTHSQLAARDMMRINCTIMEINWLIKTRIDGARSYSSGCVTNAGKLVDQRWSICSERYRVGSLLRCWNDFRFFGIVAVF